MKLTDYQLARFDAMVKDFAHRNGITSEMKTSSLDMSRTEIRLSHGCRWKCYVLFWNDVKSLTEAGTQIFTDASIYFNLTNSGSASSQFEIRDVIFNNPATIVFWADGTKTVVKCQEDDIYDEEVGLALCFAKKALGNKSNFNNVFKKWVPEVKSDYVYQGTVEMTQDLRSSAAEALEKLAGKLRRPITPDQV